MALTLSTATRNAILDAVDTLIGASGSLVFTTSASPVVEVATLTLQNPAFDAAGSAGGNSDGVMTLEGTPLSDTDATGGVMAQFHIRDNSSSPAAWILTGSVGTSNEDINFAGGVTVGAGDTVTLTSFTLTCPATPA